MDSEVTLPSVRSLSLIAAGSRRYKRLVLISHRRHLDLLDPAREDALIVSSDWLAAHMGQRRGFDIVHFEAYVQTWDERRGDDAGVWETSDAWGAVDGTDVTVFRGVPLRKLFMKDITMFIHAFGRLRTALDRICDVHQPSILEFIDLRAEYGILDEAVKYQLIREVCEDRNLTLVENRVREAPGDSGFADRTVPGSGVPVRESALRSLLRDTYTRLIDTAFALRERLSQQPAPVAVFAILNGSVREALLATVPAGRAALVLDAAGLPKTLRYLRRAWKAGARLVHCPPACLRAGDRQRLREIRETLERAWHLPARGAEQAIRTFVLDRIFATGTVEQRAAMVAGLERVFDTGGVDHLIVGDAGNPLCRAACELAKHRSIPREECLNGIYLCNQKADVRCGRGETPPVLTGFLSWGVLGSRWLRTIGSPLPCTVIGYPALDGLDRTVPVDQVGAVRRILILPLWVDSNDIHGTWSENFAWTVAAARIACLVGAEQIRIKCHPGPMNPDYFRDISDFFELEAEVFGGTGLDEHIAWADIVVGPVNSGAMVEVMANGKPYCAIQPRLTGFNPAVVDPIRPITSEAELFQALQNGPAWNTDAVLEDVASFRSIANSGSRFWAHVLASKPTADAGEMVVG